MDLRRIARPGTGQFICTQGALQLLDDKLSLFKQPVFITGNKAYQAFQAHYQGGKQYPTYFYDGSCSHENIAALMMNIPTDCDCIVGLGGGKALDTAKAIANQLNVDYITIPTVLGTCAAYTPLSIIYQPNGAIKQGEHYERAAFLCLVDLDLLVQSPKTYLLSGVGDTIAKWYEAQAAVSHLKGDIPLFVYSALNLAELIRDILLSKTEAAIQALEQQTVTPEFAHVVEAIIGLGGAVGGLAGNAARVSGAHAIHDGMSLLPETHRFEHGIKVAYGILVQLAAEQKFTQIEELLPYFDKNHFIRKLRDFDVIENQPEKMYQIAESALAEKQSFRRAVPSATVEQVVQAMQYIEQLT